MPTAPEPLIRQFRRQLRACLTYRAAVSLAAVWLFAWGVLVLVARVALGAPRFPLLWGLLGLPVAVIAAAWSARRRLPSDTSVRAFLDEHNSCGGLLMAAAECPLNGWQARIPAVGLPTVRWQNRRSYGGLVAAAVFVVLSFVAPARFTIAGTRTPLEIGREADALARRIDALKDEGFLEDKRAQALEQKLEQVKEQSSATDPGKTLEALDHLQELTAQAARQAAESSLKQAQDLTKAESLADALQQTESALDPKTLANAMKELSALTKAAAAENAAVQRELNAETRKALRENSVDAAQLNKLISALKNPKSSLKQSQDLTKAQALVEALQQRQSGLDPKTLADAMKELSALTKNAAAENEDLRDELNEKIGKALRENSLSAEQLRRLSSALKKAKQGVAKRLGKLSKARLVDPEALTQCEQCCTCDSDKVAAGLMRRSAHSRAGKGRVRPA